MLPRHMETVLVSSLQEFPVVLLTGPRQVGKSTLLAELATAAWPADMVTLDDPTVLAAATTDPDGLVARGADRPLVIDEVQRAPDVLRAIKLAVDRDRRPGRFLLTGSAHVLTLQRVSESLAGRVAVHELEPLAWAEMARRPPNTILDDLFDADGAHALLRRLTRTATPSRVAEVRDRVVVGGFPTPALASTPAARTTWFRSYRQTYLERDLRDVAGVGSLPEFFRLLSLLALRTGQIVNFSELSRDLGLPVTTLRRYFQALQQTYQVTLLPPFAANVEKRLVKTPKVYLRDTGMACHLAGADTWDRLEHQGRAGSMVETWAYGELRKLLALSTASTLVSYWRAHGGHEVDFVLERGGRAVGIEVKAGASFDAADLRGLREARAALGRRWHLGVLLHSGTTSVAIDDATVAIPFAVFFGRDGGDGRRRTTADRRSTRRRRGGRT